MTATLLSLKEISSWIHAQIERHQFKNIYISSKPCKWRRIWNFFHTRRANAQTVYVRYSYRTSLKLSLLNNEPSQTCGMLHATLQQNCCTSSSFPVTLWPWLTFHGLQHNKTLRKHSTSKFLQDKGRWWPVGRTSWWTHIIHGHISYMAHKHRTCFLYHTHMNIDTIYPRF